MSNSAKKEYLDEIRKRYFSAARTEKSNILDEVCTVCNYNRKYDIRVISKKQKLYNKKKGRPRKYQSLAITLFLKDL